MKKRKGLYRLLAAALLFCVLLSLLLGGCGPKKLLHCDGCGKEVWVSADSNMEEDWYLYCKDCQKRLGLDDLIS